MPPIQRPDLSREIAKRFGLVGFGGPESISPEIVPVYQVERPEPTQVDKMCAGAFTEAAVAGDFGIHDLSNPAGSGVVALIDRLEASTATAGTFTVQLGTTRLGNIRTKFFRDTRRSGTPACVYATSGAIAVPTADEIHTSAKAASTTLQLSSDFPIAILAPGRSIIVAFETANVAVHGAIWWRERPVSAFTDVP